MELQTPLLAASLACWKAGRKAATRKAIPMQQVAASPPTIMTTIMRGLAFLIGADGPSLGGVIRGGEEDISALFAEAGLNSLHRGFSSTVDLERLKDIAHVVLNRFLGDAQPRGDFFVP